MKKSLIKLKEENMDVNEMMGRTLGEVLESRGNDETLCFIGSASSYFCIGTLQEID